MIYAVADDCYSMTPIALFVPVFAPTEMVRFSTNVVMVIVLVAALNASPVILVIFVVGISIVWLNVQLVMVNTIEFTS